MARPSGRPHARGDLDDAPGYFDAHSPYRGIYLRHQVDPRELASSRQADLGASVDPCQGRYPMHHVALRPGAISVRGVRSHSSDRVERATPRDCGSHPRGRTVP